MLIAMVTSLVITDYGGFEYRMGCLSAIATAVSSAVSSLYVHLLQYQEIMIFESLRTFRSPVKNLVST